MKYFLLFFLSTYTSILLGQNVGGQSSFPAVPGETPVIFLDFDGHEIESGNNWTGFTGGSTFTASASGLSENDKYVAYQVMAEDFRPWKVAVTTDESIYDAAPENARMRVIFTQSSDWYGGGASGAAFMESFNWSNTPCFVFTNVLGLSGKYAGDAGSHQVGHTMNLPHHSLFDENCEIIAEYNTGNEQGEIRWAPIMGTAYYSNLGTWDDGQKVSPTYCDIRMRADVDIISTLLELRSDDYTSPVDMETKIESGAISFQVEGSIEHRDDEDPFILSVPQQTTMQISIQAPLNNENMGFANNLDAKLLIYDQVEGSMHEYSDPGSVGTNVEFTFMANRPYTLIVTNDENEWMSDYGSLGSYVISGVGVLPGGELSVSLGPDTSLCMQLIEEGYQLNADPEGKNPTGTTYKLGNQTKTDDPVFTVFQPGAYIIRATNENAVPVEVADTIIIDGIRGAVPRFSMMGGNANHCVAFITFTDNSSSLCNSIDSIKLEFGDGQYALVSAGDQVIHSYDKEGSYTVKQVVYADGEEFRHQRTLNIKLASYPTDVLGMDVKVCEGTLATLELNTKYQYDSYMWLDNQNAGMSRRVGSGEYIVTGETKDANGNPTYCYFKDTIEVTTSRSVLPNFEMVSNAIGEVSFKNTTVTCDGSQPSRYRWIFPGGKESNEVNPTVRFSSFGDVVVTLIASTDTESQTIEKVVRVTWAKTPFSRQRVYGPGYKLPRAKSEVLEFQITKRMITINGSALNIHVEGLERRAYQLFGADGRLYGKGQLIPGNNIIDAMGVPKGLFFMRVIGAQEQEVFKFIKP